MSVASGGPIDGTPDKDRDKPLASNFKFGVTRETPQTQTSQSPLTKNNNEPLLHWPNSFPHALPNPRSVPSMDYLCWLLECHRLQQLPLSSEITLEEVEDLAEDVKISWDLVMHDLCSEYLWVQGRVSVVHLS
jgi:hypothetical protein